MVVHSDISFSGCMNRCRWCREACKKWRHGSLHARCILCIGVLSQNQKRKLTVVIVSMMTKLTDRCTLQVALDYCKRVMSYKLTNVLRCSNPCSTYGCCGPRLHKKWDNESAWHESLASFYAHQVTIDGCVTTSRFCGWYNTVQYTRQTKTR